MYQAVLNYVPQEWRQNVSEIKVALYEDSEEYRKLRDEVDLVVRDSSVNVSTIYRVQDVYSYGQFLIRCQLLAVSGSSEYFTVRRYMTIPRTDIENAIKYNLDYRRCSFSQVALSKTVSFVNTLQALVVIQVVTKYPDDSSIVPETFLEYYIEYIITFD